MTWPDGYTKDGYDGDWERQRNLKKEMESQAMIEFMIDITARIERLETWLEELAGGDRR